MESEIWGDEAPAIVIDDLGNIVKEDVYDTLDEVMEEILIPFIKGL